MNPNDILKAAAGPYGALFLLLVAVVYLWRRLEQIQAMLLASQTLLTRNQELFGEALKVIKDDLVPLVRELADRRR
jgi:hypothetical protein